MQIVQWFETNTVIYKIPDPYRLVIRTREEVFTIWTEHKACDPLVMSFKLHDLLTTLSIPNDDVLVSWSCSHEVKLDNDLFFRLFLFFLCNLHLKHSLLCNEFFKTRFCCFWFHFLLIDLLSLIILGLLSFTLIIIFTPSIFLSSLIQILSNRLCSFKRRKYNRINLILMALIKYCLDEIPFCFPISVPKNDVLFFTTRSK